MAWLFGCKCSKFPRWKIANQYSKPFNAMCEIDFKKNDFTVLVKCKKCNQHWQIDAGYYDMNLAIKIDNPKHWHLLSDFQSRREAMIENHGGISNEKCKSSGCTNNAMHDMEFCAECAYIHMNIRA